MISFIIIGKNESRTLSKTIKSVYQTIEENKITDAEVIYVDSHSDDESLTIAKSFDEIKVFLITGDANAAIARNIGANEAKGDILCFLDGDMELNPKFISVGIKNGKLVYPFISGQLLNKYYTKDWQYSGESVTYPNLQKDEYSPQTGGFFMIEKEKWNTVKGMKTKYRRSQDIDLALRLTKIGIPILRKTELFAVHHTIDYFDKTRRWKMLIDGSFLFQTSVLYRDHLFNKYVYSILVRNSYSFLILLMVIAIVPFDWRAIFIYPIVLFLRILGQYYSSSKGNLIYRYIYFLILDIFIMCGFFIFFPNEKIIQYRMM